MGPLSDGHTRVERIDDAIGFTPSNCRWALPNMGRPVGKSNKARPEKKKRNWAGMHKSTLYLEPFIFQNIQAEVERLQVDENRRVSVPTLIRETIEARFWEKKSR